MYERCPTLEMFEDTIQNREIVEHVGNVHFVNKFRKDVSVGFEEYHNVIIKDIQSIERSI